MGFFGPTAEFDDFVATHAAPVLEGAGFKRSGRIFRYTSKTATVVVQASLFTPIPNTSFHVLWGVLPAALRDYHAGGRRGWKPTLSKALVRSTLRPSHKDLGRWELGSFVFTDPRVYNDQDWGVSKATPMTIFGPRFEEELASRGLPLWRRMHDPDYLYDVYHHPYDDGLIKLWAGGGSYPSGDDFAHALVDVDFGPLNRAQASINTVEARWPTDPIVPWLKERLDQRQSPT